MTTPGPLRLISALINRSISQSETARSEVAALHGQCLEVEVQGVGLTLQALASDGEVQLSAQATTPPQVTIAGPPLALVKLLSEPQPDAATLRRLSISLRGDEQVAADFARLLRHARPDLEEELSNIIGDIAAHQVGSALRALHSFGSRTVDTLRQNTSEFLQEESRMMPSRLEVRSFCNAVDEARDAVERAAARLKRLERRSSEPS